MIIINKVPQIKQMHIWGSPLRIICVALVVLSVIVVVLLMTLLLVLRIVAIIVRDRRVSKRLVARL